MPYQLGDARRGAGDWTRTNDELVFLRTGQHPRCGHRRSVTTVVRRRGRRSLLCLRSGSTTPSYELRSATELPADTVDRIGLEPMTSASRSRCCLRTRHKIKRQRSKTAAGFFDFEAKQPQLSHLAQVKTVRDQVDVADIGVLGRSTTSHEAGRDSNPRLPLGRRRTPHLRTGRKLMCPRSRVAMTV